jgi:Asp-tRNA(Asn)/Glu-tRNA(Gln) amidotransferase A subunit family amidase
MTELCDLDAVEARHLIAAKQLSPVELLDSCIRRIETINPAVNAMVATCFERAREEAAAAEAAVAHGEPLGPLHGLPIGIKDLNDTEGLRTTYGSLIFKDHVPAADERIVAAVRRAGAIVIGKTNSPEFGAGANTVNKVYGATRNPFNTDLTCGGSSGGAAVALATGMAPLATGSDTGGSLRTPAAFCGVVGVRPTPGLVPSDKRKIGLTNFGVQGPMARTVADAALLLSAMAGDDRCDPLSTAVDAAAYRDLPDVDLSRLRVAISEDLGICPVDDAIRQVFRQRSDRIAAVFSERIDGHPDFSHAHEAFWALRGAYFVAGFKEHYEKRREQLGPLVVSNVEAGLKMSVADVAWAAAEQTRIYRDFHRFFDNGADLLVCPAAPVPPFPVEELYCRRINGRELDNYIQWVSIT